MVRSSMLRLLTVLSAVCTLGLAEQTSAHRRQSNASCPGDYTDYATVGHAPYSVGRYRLPSQRPPLECRTYVSQEVEDAIEEMRDVITDPDLFRMFENSFPNTLGELQSCVEI